MSGVAARSEYTTGDVARLLGWSRSAVRRAARNGYVRAGRDSRGRYLFSFQDLVALRAVRQLKESGLSERRIAQALGRLVDELPAEKTLAAVRLVADGDRVVVEDGGEIYNPETGQRVLDFEGSVRSSSAAPLEHGPRGDDAGEGPDLAAEEWYLLGVELETDNPLEAKRAYRKALELDDTLGDAHLNLGRLFHEEGRLRNAETCYRAAVSHSPGDATAHFNLAVALEDLGRPMEALWAYEQAIRIDPEYADAYYNVAGIYERLGKRAEAVRYLKTYKSLTGD